MCFFEEEITQLKNITPNLCIAEEGGYTYIFIEGLKLPDNCQPKIVDALLCPTPICVYKSRLYFSQKIEGCPPSRNWNGNLRAIDRNWFAISWQSNDGLKLHEMLSIHINALRI